MKLIKVFVAAFAFLLVFPILANAEALSLNITIREAVSQRSAYDSINGERNTGLSATGIPLVPLAFNGNISIANSIDEIISDINITLSNTSNIASQFTIQEQPSYANVNITKFERGNKSYVYIKQLNPGDRVILRYDIQNLNFGEPINITETYTKTKVLTNSTFNITMNISNHLIDNILIFDINVTKVPYKHLGADGNPRYFNFSEIYGNDTPYANVKMLGGRSVLEWNTSGKTLDKDEYAWLSFVTRAPVDLNTTWEDNTWGQYMVIGNVTVQFKMNTSISGLRIMDVNSLAKAEFTVIKNRINESHWKIGFNFTNKAGSIDYNLTTVTVWATQYGNFEDPGNLSTWINNTKSPYAQISPDSRERGNVSFEINQTTLEFLEVDLNDDMQYYDRVYVHNGTHLLFNLTGNQAFFVKLLNTTGEDINISYATTIPVVVEINETNLTYDGKWLGSFSLNGTIDEDYVIDPSKTVFFINETVDTQAKYTWTLNQNIEPSRGWQNDTFHFNYSYVPVVWGRVKYKITDVDEQIAKKYRVTENSSGYYYYEEIYVLSGYILKASKYIQPSNVFDNVYNITVIIENIGNDKTPDLITVYDMIPKDFWVLNLTNNETDLDDKTIVNGININITMSNLTRGINNSGYIRNNNSIFNGYWGFRIDFHPLQRGSNDDGVYQIANNRSEIKIFYMINGTGQLANIKNAFIVGIDPVRLEGAHPGKYMNTVFGLESESNEAVTLILSMLAVVGILGMAYGFAKKPHNMTKK